MQEIFGTNKRYSIMKFSILSVLISLLFLAEKAGAQQYLYPVDSIYLSGVVFDADSVNTLPGAHVSLNHKPVASTDNEGRFIIYMSRKDTLTISYLGFQEFVHVFPEKTYRDEFFMRIPLSRDSIVLQTVEVYPWPKKGAFRQAFLDAQNADKKDVPIIIIGASQNDGPKTEAQPDFTNPASLLQKAFSKQERNRRKLKKYRKELQNEYFEFQR